MAEVHRDKNGNPLKGAALHSHIIYTHDGGPEAHDAAIAQEAARRAIRQYLDARHTARKKRQGGNILQRLIKR